MHITARLPILIGAGLLSAAIGAGPAQAAGSSAQGPQPPHNQGDTVGYFDNRMDCEWVGTVGESQDRWNSHDCTDVNFGPYHGMWRLDVDRSGDHDTGWPGHDNGGHGNGGHGNGGHDNGGHGHGGNDTGGHGGHGH